MTNVGIIGCGLIGEKRAKALTENDKIVFCYDTNSKTMIDFQKKYQTHLWDYGLLDNVNTVIISTPNNFLFEYGECYLNLGKNVLIEKPGAMSSNQLKKLRDLANEKNLKIKIGYNHRFHPSFVSLTNWDIENIYYVDAMYGHGGSHLESKNDWRLNPLMSGGGDLMDKMCHLIDLVQFVTNQHKFTYHCDLRNYKRDKLEDNVFLTLYGENNFIANLRTSCTEWKNNFEFSIVNSDKKIVINGLGGSYGDEKITWYGLQPEQIKPISYSEEFFEDLSWSQEWEYFTDILQPENCTLEDEIVTMQIIENIYRENSK